MTNNPTFKPGDVVWHVQHGKATLDHYGPGLVWCYTSERRDVICENGKVKMENAGRVLFTLSEAEQYGWYKPEPLRVEFDEVVLRYPSLDPRGVVSLSDTRLSQLNGKRVRITVEELP